MELMHVVSSLRMPIQIRSNVRWFGGRSFMFQCLDSIFFGARSPAERLTKWTCAELVQVKAEIYSNEAGGDARFGAAFWNENPSFLCHFSHGFTNQCDDFSYRNGNSKQNHSTCGLKPNNIIYILYNFMIFYVYIYIYRYIPRVMVGP